LTGTAGEAAVAAALSELGIPVYFPFGEGALADLIAEFGDRPQRIQVKSSNADTPTIRFYLGRRNSRQHGWRLYPPGTLDWFALYARQYHEIVLIPAAGAPQTITVQFRDASRPISPTTINARQNSVQAVLARLSDKENRYDSAAESGNAKPHTAGPDKYYSSQRGISHDQG
jgi:hypothetical protein